MSYPQDLVSITLSASHTRKVYRRLLSRSAGLTSLVFACGVFVAACALLVATVLVTSNAAHASAEAKVDQSAKLSVPPYSVGVSPQITDLGVARTITAIGIWNDACPPTSASVEDDLAQGLSTLIVRLRVPETLVACAQVPTSYKLDVTYVPKQRGVLKVFALTQAGTPLGQTRLVTSTSTAPRARVDLTGLWYDPATNGSGLTFIHAYAGSDLVFGTWYLYDTARKPRWYTIQAATWKNDGQVMEGKLYETAAKPCSGPAVSCPVIPVLDTVKEVGTVRVSFDPAFGVIFDKATAEAFSSTGQLLFSSTIEKIRF
jgi:hypothetical protein